MEELDKLSKKYGWTFAIWIMPDAYTIQAVVAENDQFDAWEFEATVRREYPLEKLIDEMALYIAKREETKNRSDEAVDCGTK